MARRHGRIPHRQRLRRRSHARPDHTRGRGPNCSSGPFQHQLRLHSRPRHANGMRSHLGHARHNPLNCPTIDRADAHVLYDCPNDQQLLRSHSFNAAAKIIQKHRVENPNGRCRIISGLHSPVRSFAAKFLDENNVNNCPDTKVPVDDLIRDFRRFLITFDFQDTFEMAIDDILSKYGTFGATTSVRWINVNKGYSIIQPVPEYGIMRGCELLFLRVEENHRWPDFFKTIFPDAQYFPGDSWVKVCPQALDHLMALQDYSLTMDEKEFILSKHGKLARDWFDAYHQLK